MLYSKLLFYEPFVAENFWKDWWRKIETKIHYAYTNHWTENVGKSLVSQGSPLSHFQHFPMARVNDIFG